MTEEDAVATDAVRDAAKDTVKDMAKRTEGVEGVLVAIEDAVVSARAMPMSASVLVNRAEMLTLVDQVRQALPGQLHDADKIVASADAERAAARADAERAVAAARADTERIVADARARADRMVAAEQIVVEAQDQAEQVLRIARAEAEALRVEADDYCDRCLADLEIDLGKVLAQVQAGRARLAGRLATD